MQGLNHQRDEHISPSAMNMRSMAGDSRKRCGRVTPSFSTKKHESSNDRVLYRYDTDVPTTTSISIP